VEWGRCTGGTPAAHYHRWGDGGDCRWGGGREGGWGEDVVVGGAQTSLEVLVNVH